MWHVSCLGKCPGIWENRTEHFMVCLGKTFLWGMSKLTPEGKLGIVQAEKFSRCVEAQATTCKVAGKEAGA